jgi:DnaJ-class molecular chaperone
MGKFIQVLGLSPFEASSYTIEGIKEAYRKMALQYHPDRTKDTSTARKFIEIQNAYEQCVKELWRTKK